MREDEAEPVHGRVTNGDLARRLDRVEGIQEQHGVRLHELGNEVGVVKLQVEHAQEMIRIRFTSLEAGMATVTTKLDALLDRSTAQNADPSATSAGRQILEDIEELRVWQRAQQPTIDSARTVMGVWRLVIGGSVFTALASVVAFLIAIGVIRIP